MISYKGMERPEGTTNVKGTQTPGVALANEAENAAKIIRKYYAPEPRTIDEARRLENFLILSGELRSTLQIVQ